MNGGNPKSLHRARSLVAAGFMLLVAGCGRVTTSAVTASPAPATMTPRPLRTRTPAPPSSSPTSMVTPTAFKPTPTSRLASVKSLTDSRDRIAWVSERDGDHEIYIAAIGDGPVFRLTKNPADDTRPALGPDGRTLAFVSDRDGDREIYLMDVETEEIFRLTNNPAEDTDPAWSPDGRQLAFRSDRDGNNEIYVIDVACASQMEGCVDETRRLTNGLSDDLVPAWSPSGEKIAFMSARQGNLDLYLMDADGTNVSRLTDNPGVDGFPSWSPDGTRIAYHSERDGHTYIYVMDVNTGEEDRLTSTLTGYEGEEMAPTWSADGQWIAFMCSEWWGGSMHIEMRGAPGTPMEGKSIPMQNTFSEYFDGFPSWGRDDPARRVLLAPTSKPGFSASQVYPRYDRQSPSLFYTREFSISPDRRWIATYGGYQPDTYPEYVLPYVLPMEAAACLELWGSCGDALWRLTEEPMDYGLMVPGGFAWSPDSRRLAYLRARELVVIFDLSGHRPFPSEALTLGDLTDVWDLLWSPDGSTLFLIAKEGWEYNLYRRRLSDDEWQLLRPGALEAAISPDGSKIVCLEPMVGSTHVWVISYADGRRITGILGPGLHREPFGATTAAWSPDGKQIALEYQGPWQAWTHDQPIEKVGVYIANEDGTDLKEITEGIKVGYLNALSPAWSLDGRYIAFVAESEFDASELIEGPEADLFVVRPDGSGLTQITDLPGREDHPVWSSDGRYLYFWSMYGPKPGMWKVEVGSLP